MAILDAAAVAYYAKVAFAVFILRCILVYTYRITLHPLNKYPGPLLARLSSLHGAWHAAHTRGHRIAYESHEKYGPVVRIAPNRLIFNSAAAMRDIYHNDRFYKSPEYCRTQFSPTMWHSLGVIDKNLHRPRRRLVSHALSDRSIRKIESSMSTHIDTFVKILLDSLEPVNMSQRCKWLGFDIIGSLAFGADVNLQTSPKQRWLIPVLRGMLYRISVYVASPAAGIALYWASWPLVQLGRLKFYYTLKAWVQRRIALGHHARDDLLSFLVDHTDPETGAKFSLREIWGEAVFLFPAGGDTVSTTTTALFFYLARNPAAAARLAHELDSTFFSGPSIRLGPALSSCTYLRACIDEALRMSPPVSAVPWRTLAPHDTAPLAVDAHPVPPGTSVGVSIYALHHSPECFPEPFEFRPERWLAGAEGGAAGRTAREAFSPFSVGPRACPGKAMAYAEAGLVVARVVWYCEFEEEGGPRVGGELELSDHVVTSSDGPYLRLRPRGEFYKDLFEERKEEGEL